MVSMEEYALCKWCFNESTLSEWNDLTYSKCTNREMKRKFTSLSDEKAFMKKSDTFYICPKCYKWSRGSEIRVINTKNQKLIKLGVHLIKDE